jgi:ethanolamine ammonia-lyase large subunit
MDSLMTLLGAAGVNFLIAVPGADDVMLNYQSLSFHDIVGLRSLLGLLPAPEFLDWLGRMALLDVHGRLVAPAESNALLQRLAP